MSRISKADRQLQLQREEAGDHLFANRVKVYPKSVRGPVRRFKWAVLIVCLGIYYLLPWLRWHRGVNQPDQAVLLSIWRERFYFSNLEFWPQDIYYLTGRLIMAAVTLFLVASLPGRVSRGSTFPQPVWPAVVIRHAHRAQGGRKARQKRSTKSGMSPRRWRSGGINSVTAARRK